jgi:hypothetical protein
VSCDSIALMVTALLGVGSFIVQAVTEKRASRAAAARQKDSDRELTERESSRTVSPMQLERVRLQMSEYARGVAGHPLHALLGQVPGAALECRAQG